MWPSSAVWRGGRLWRDVFTPQATFPALSRRPPSRATLLLLHAGTPSLRRAVHTTRARHAERCRARQKRARTGTGLLVSRRVSSVAFLPPTKGRCGGRRGGARHGVFRSENRTQWHDALGAQASAWNGFSFPSLEVITVGPARREDQPGRAAGGCCCGDVRPGPLRLNPNWRPCVI